jgi:hypothetical protein
LDSLKASTNSLSIVSSDVTLLANFIATIVRRQFNTNSSTTGAEVEETDFVEAQQL